MPADHNDQSVAREPRVYGCMHVATQGKWDQVVKEQLSLIRASGLYARMERLFVGVVGPRSESFHIDDPKIEIVHRSAEIGAYEFPTLKFLHSLCWSHEGLVFYIHTKGVFRDNAATNDWRHYMEYFVIERYPDCIAALVHRDVCGVNWQTAPWPHFSGNFWWARTQYVATLAPLDLLGPVADGWNQGPRHLCERWIGSGKGVRPASFHQTHLDHYLARCPREMYVGPPPTGALRTSRVALIYDSVVRPDTTGVYCLRALRHLAQVSQFLPFEADWIPPGYFDLFLYVDDGLDYQIRSDLHPSAFWAIDTHLNPQRLIARVREIDFVFAAQRDGVELLRRNRINCVGWLPLACDPEIHQKYPCDKELDVCFVAHLCTEERHAMADRIRTRFPRSFIGQRFFSEMAKTYSSSRIVLNLSVRNDINMRVFEALACGSLLITNDLSENGLDQFFADGQHLVTYRGLDDLVDQVQRYLSDHEARERIAAQGRQEALARHTYLDRMKVLLDNVLAGKRAPAITPQQLPAGHASAPPRELTSVIVVACNALEYTKVCLESLERHTIEPHELIVVDNGSTDGTRQFLRARLSVRLIENQENRGFPAAVNQAIRASRGARILLLNNDAIVTPGWLDRLIAVLHSAPDIGLTGPCSNEVSGPQRVSASYSNLLELQTFAQRWATEHRDEQVEVQRLVGFCVLMRRDVVDRIGLLDERFGIGNFEDDDYCRRALLAGFRAVIARDCFVHHFGSATFKTTGADYAAIIEKNQRLFAEKWETTLPADGAMEVRETAATAIPVASHEPNLSLCMIVRDSSRTLRPCLESARPWVDEIILVDTGSTDETPRIAEEAGAAVRYFQWCDDFAAARNESLKTARGRWLFWMDADDTISPENGRKLRELVSQPHPSEMLGFVLQVHCPAGQGPYSTATVVDHVKVFRNDPQIRFSGRIHEQVLPAIRGLGGDVGWTDIFVTHSGSDHSAEGRARKQKRDLRILQLELGEDPDHTFTLFNMGMTLLDMGRAGDALSPLCQSLQLASPGDSHMRKIYALLAQAYAELGRPQTALKTCIQGLEVCPGDAELLFRCGTLRQQLGQLDTAEECFRAVIEPKRDRYFCSVDRGILGIKAWHNLAVLYDQRQQFDRAAQAWLRVLDYDHSNRSAWHGLLESFTAGNDAAGLQRLCELAPDGQVPRETRLLARARLVTQGGNPAAAVAELERAANEDPSGELLNELCELAFKHEMLDVAERGLVELTRRSPEDASACHNLALVRLRRGDHAEAARWARRSLELRPNYAPSRHLLEDATRAQRSNGAPDAEPAAINVSIGDSLIGDALFTEPAVRALAAALQRRIPLLLHGTPRALFLNHPSVSLVSSEAEATGRWIHIDPVTALAFARPHRCHICCGFFPQLGLDPQGADVKPRLWREGLEPGNRPSRAQRNARIALAPFSASCLGHRTGVPNKTIALEWWNELVRKLPLPADSFGAAHEPPLECAENLRGLPLDEVSGWLRRYELLITTDNGICAIAGALNCDIVLLESASAPWLTGPQTEGRFEVVYSGVPPAWAHGDVVAAVKRILDTAVVSAAQELA